MRVGHNTSGRRAWFRVRTSAIYAAWRGRLAEGPRDRINKANVFLVGQRRCNKEQITELADQSFPINTLPGAGTQLAISAPEDVRHLSRFFQQASQIRQHAKITTAPPNICVY